MYPIISSSELTALIHAPSVVVLDARTGPEARQQYEKGHLPGARFVDLETDLAQVTENAAFGGRHPLPSPERFKNTLENLGIKEDAHLVIYDTASGANAAARCWWMLKAFGFVKVQVLSGGLQAAEKAGLPLQSGTEKAEKTHLEAPKEWRWPTADLQEVEQALAADSAAVIDVRDAYRYRGESEPIDLVAGHIPGAVNIPFSENLDKNGNFLSKEELKQKYSLLFEGMPTQKIVHCGSGVTACHTLLALEAAGLGKASLYVGSWSEWSRREGMPIATQP